MVRLQYSMNASTFRFSIFDQSKVAALDDFANQDTEPNLHLIHPGSMFGCVVKDNAMCRITQECRA